MKKLYWILRLVLIGLFTICPIESTMGNINISQIHLGFNPPYYKRNAWIPLQLRLENDGEEFNGKVEVEVKNIFAGVTQRYSKPLSLPRKALRNLYFYVFSRSITSKFSVHLIDDEGAEVFEKEFTPDVPKRRQDFLILALTPNIDMLANLTGGSLESNRNFPIYQKGNLPDILPGTIYVTYFDGKTNLPDTWKGYDSIDFVVIRDISLESHNISRKRQMALIEWICSGGTLLISGGGNIQYLSGSFLEPLLPVTSMRLRTDAAIPILTQLFGLDFSGQRRFELIDSKLRDGSRSLINTEEETPIISEREIGDGKIIFLAFDYSDPNFSLTGNFRQRDVNLGGRVRLWRWLLNDVVQSKLKRESLFDRYRRHEIRIGRLLSSTEKSHSPLLKFVGAFLSAYAIGFGLFIYLFPNRTKTAKMAWLGGLCVIFIFALFPVSLHYVKKGVLRINGFSIVNIYPQYARAFTQPGGLRRRIEPVEIIETYLGLLSSDNSKCNLQSDAKLFMRPLDDALDTPYDFVQTKEFQYRGIQLNPWTVQKFHLESYQKLDGTIESDLQQIDGTLKGKIRNNLPFDLSDSYITYGRFYDKIGVFNRGAETSVRVDKRYLGDVPKAIFEAANAGRAAEQRAFARILADESVLRYLSQPTKPTLIGWTQSPILKFNIDRSYKMANRVLVIIHIDGNY
ncbi:MAG: hypothetical protein ACE5PV_14905 [Candidatus Poribacteria bacterium]